MKRRIVFSSPECSPDCSPHPPHPPVASTARPSCSAKENRPPAPKDFSKTKIGSRQDYMKHASSSKASSSQDSTVRISKPAADLVLSRMRQLHLSVEKEITKRQELEAEITQNRLKALKLSLEVLKILEKHNLCLASCLRPQRLQEEILSQAPGPKPTLPLPDSSHQSHTSVSLKDLIKKHATLPRIEPDFIETVQNAPSHIRIASRFEALAAEHPDGEEGYLLETEKQLRSWIETVQSNESPLSRKNRKRIVTSYMFMVCKFRPSIALQKLWDADVVMDFPSYKMSKSIVEGERNGTLSSTLTISKQQIFNLVPITLAHNMLFDVTTYFVADLFLRQAFEKKYATITDLLDDNRSQIPLDPQVLNQPLFLAITNGGRGFQQPVAPAMSLSVSETVAKLARKAGLPVTGAYALRRDTGNDFGAMMGKDFARMLLGHTLTGACAVYEKHYSRNTANLNPVMLRLGELDGAHASAKNVAKKHAFASCAVESMVRKGIEKADTENISKAERHKAVEALPEIIALKEQIASTWDEYLKGFTSSAKTYGHTIQSANKIFALATGAKKNRIEDNPPLRVLPDMMDHVVENKAKLISLSQELSKQRRHFERKAKREADRIYSNQLKHGTLSGTAEERFAAIKELDKVSKHITNLKSSPLMNMQEWAVEVQNQDELLPVHFQDQDDLDLDSGIMELTQRLTNVNVNELLPSPSLEVSTKSAFSVEPNVTGTDVESIEMDFLSLPMEEVRQAFLNFLVHPVMMDRLIRSNMTAEGKYKCHRCTLYTHCDPVPSKTFSNIGNLNRHLDVFHSAWKDLELAMIIPDKTTFRCPAGDFIGYSVKEVRTHMLSENCTSQEEYSGMSNAHQALVDKLQNYNNGPRENVKKSYPAKKAKKSKRTHSSGDLEADIESIDNFLSSLQTLFEQGDLPEVAECDLTFLQNHQETVKNASRPSNYDTVEYEDLGNFQYELCSDSD
ncbi:hypothetical protein C0993_002814 [Termitomyces sp. T159_Od127]|nr:hypothetical protein C0993_002814 [Termitomyces sp. T159_Od127]